MPCTPSLRPAQAGTDPDACSKAASNTAGPRERREGGRSIHLAAALQGERWGARAEHCGGAGHSLRSRVRYDAAAPAKNLNPLPSLGSLA